MKQVKHFEHIATTLEAAIKDGRDIAPWMNPWVQSQIQPFNPSAPRKLSNGKQYLGMNDLWLCFLTYQNGYKMPFWGTRKHWTKLGATKFNGSPAWVYWWAKVKIKEGTPEEKEIFMVKTYKVFNADQVEGIDRDKLQARLDRLAAKNAELNGVPVDHKDPALATESTVKDWLDSESIKLVEGGNRACYSKMIDEIRMPLVGQFKDRAEYARTLAHEACHATGHDTRLSRELGNKFGSKKYAREELIAEMGSAMLMAAHGEQFNEDQCVAYLKGWLGALKDDKGDPDYGVLPWAAGRAGKAAGLIMGYAEVTEDIEEPAMA